MSVEFQPVPSVLVPAVVVGPVAFVPELVLGQAPVDAGLWDATGGQYHSDRPPPFWAFAWPGGLALARHLLDHPELVAGRRVLDVGAGSGVAAIAAARAGAAHVRAVDVDPAAVAAILANASANGVTVDASADDVLDGAGGDADVVLGADIFYTAALAGRAMPFVRRAQRRGALVLVSDPGRGYLRTAGFTPLAVYDVPTRLPVEDTRSRATTVFRLADVSRS